MLGLMSKEEKALWLATFSSLVESREYRAAARCASNVVLFARRTVEDPTGSNLRPEDLDALRQVMGA